MKKVALFMALALVGAAASAGVNRSELRQLQNFLNQPAEHAATNAQALNITNLNDPTTWEGITVVGNNITEIKWKDKKLSGTLDLSGFSALTTVDVSRNRINELTVSGDPVLTELNASRNRITKIDFSGCPRLSKVSINNNRITEFTLDNVPLLKNLNVSSNLLAEPVVFAHTRDTELPEQPPGEPERDRLYCA